MKKILKKYIPKQDIKVSLFIVGAQKAGTSALHDYLTKHPRISGGYKKEINFFNHPEKFEKGFKWYHQQFNRPLFYKKSNQIYIDSTPQYLSNLDVAKKIYHYNQHANIVILLREPVSRAYSAWNMYKQFSELTQERKKALIKMHIPKKQISSFQKLINKNPFYTFEEYVNQELNNNRLINFYPYIIKRGIYYDQVKAYYDHFKQEKIQIVESDNFKSNKLNITNQIINKLNFNSLKLDENTLQSVHQRKYDSGINKETKQKLKNFYKPYNEKLFNLIGPKFDW